MKIYKTIKLFFTLFLGIIIILPFLAPLLAYFGYKTPAKIIYSIYHFMCHQKAHRSIFILDHQCAWCTRDTFIWTTLFVIALLVLWGPQVMGLNWKMALVFILPMALDGTIQLIGTITSISSHQAPFYESTNSIRAITGTFFGIGVGMFLLPRLRKELDTLEKT